MRVIPVLVVVAGLVLCQGEAKRSKWKFEGDFEFADEETSKAGDKKRWIHDPSSELCRPLKCKKKEICLLEDPFTAVCVSRKELKKNGDIVVPRTPPKKEASKKDAADDDDDVFYDAEDDLDDESKEDSVDSLICRPCPVVKPVFLCGSDNRTYSSLCRLDYHNCIHHTSVKVTCKGFCPCKENEPKAWKKQRQSERLSNFINKYKATLDKDRPEAAASKADDYSFVPQDIKYDNKHYKYMKYTKYNKDAYNILYAEDKERTRGYNDVTDNKIYDSAGPSDPALPVAKQCSPVALQAMGNRLLDWFSVVMVDSSKRHRIRTKSKARFPSSCKVEVRWMFQHLDSSGDSKLSLEELYDLEHDQSEVCLKPFLQRCDADADSSVTPSEWCKCFQRTERPCAAVRHKIVADGAAAAGVYVPDCDSLGYYKPAQCHAAIGMCWCVDKHGVEFANTRTRAKPNCDSIMKTDDASNNNSGVGNDPSDDEDDLEDVEGSADHPADY
ncbi:proteoglycan Cow [Cylas formicarius]|uniref:proteoglycan Cow n=1 Tax=Cylas formicarius TaxID=197179 RepID=UPI0029586005|nr:proteoglycan Cow [Cylas formicarius]